jgi:hypothetical protein
VLWNGSEKSFESEEFPSRGFSILRGLLRRADSGPHATTAPSMHSQHFGIFSAFSRFLGPPLQSGHVPSSRSRLRAFLDHTIACRNPSSSPLNDRVSRHGHILPLGCVQGPPIRSTFSSHFLDALVTDQAIRGRSKVGWGARAGSAGGTWVPSKYPAVFRYSSNVLRLVLLAGTPGSSSVIPSIVAATPGSIRNTASNEGAATGWRCPSHSRSTFSTSCSDGVVIAACRCLSRKASTCRLGGRMGAAFNGREGGSLWIIKLRDEITFERYM